MPVDLRHDPDPASGPVPHSLGHFDESKGVTGLAISPSSVIIAGAAGAVSIIDIASGQRYSTHVDIASSSRCQASDTVKILRLHALSNTSFLVLTSHAVLVYPLPSLQTPYGSAPTFAQPIFPSVSAWIQPHPSRVSSSSLLLTILTLDNRILRFVLAENPDTLAWSIVDTREYDETLFPYPVDRLSLTDMHGGARRSVWVHWERGVDGWPLHVMAGQSSGEDNEWRSDRPSTLEFRSLTSSDHRLEGCEFGRLVETCTRSVSMPRICFDEGTGRLILAGMAAPSLALCDFA